jgi:uncharacterized protein (TIGR03083 family)
LPEEKRGGAMLAYDRYYGAIAQAAAEMADLVPGTDPATRVPTCPDWTFADLVAHVGRAHRWAITIVERRATEFVPFDQIDDLAVPEDLVGRAEWLRKGAWHLAHTIADVGPETPVWSWADAGHAGFWARRMAHETSIHSADAALTAGRTVSLPADLSADGISEGLGFIASHVVAERKPSLAALRGNGETLHFHSTDGWLGRDGEWFVNRNPDGVEWRHGHGKADVAVRGDAADLALLLTRRIPLDSPAIEVLGDRALMEHWLSNTAF